MTRARGHIVSYTEGLSTTVKGVIVSRQTFHKGVSCKHMAIKIRPLYTDFKTVYEKKSKIKQYMKLKHFDLLHKNFRLSLFIQYLLTTYYIPNSFRHRGHKGNPERKTLALTETQINEMH